MISENEEKLTLNSSNLGSINDKKVLTLALYKQKAKQSQSFK